MAADANRLKIILILKNKFMAKKIKLVEGVKKNKILDEAIINSLLYIIEDNPDYTKDMVADEFATVFSDYEYQYNLAMKIMGSK